MAKKLTLKERAKYYECLSRILDFIDSQIEDFNTTYEVIGTHEEVKEDGTTKTVRDWGRVARDYEQLSDDDKLLVNAWRAVREQVEEM